MKKPNYPTLNQLGMNWVVNFELIGTAVFFFLVLLGFVLPLFGFPYTPMFAGTGLLSMFLLGFIHDQIFYSRVKCPDCNGKLNRFKNGKRVPIKQAHTQLGNGYGCRHCGWKPQSANAGD